MLVLFTSKNHWAQLLDWLGDEKVSWTPAGESSVEILRGFVLALVQKNLGELH